MLNLNNKISIRQLQALLVLDIFGTGVAVLPRIVANRASQDGWVCVIIATFLAALAVYIITTLANRFHGKSFFEYSSLVLGRPLAVVVSLAFIIRIILGAAFQLRFFGEIVRQTLLPKTPFGIVCAAMLILGAYAAAKGYETRGRIAEVLVIIVILPLLFVFLAAMRGIDFTNLMPVMTSGYGEISLGTFEAVFAFSGIELLLLVFPYLGRTKSARKASIAAIALTGFFMLIITVVTIARFGAEDIKNQLWPVLEMMDAVNVPGAMVERQEALVMSFWIVSVFAMINAGLFFSSLLLRDVISRGKQSTYILLLLPLIFGITYIPDNIVIVSEYIAITNKSLGLAFMLVIPVGMLLISKVRRLKKDA